jgi:hypothetical protein
VEDFTIQLINPSMHKERQLLFDQLAKEYQKLDESNELFFRACANINSET